MPMWKRATASLASIDKQNLHRVQLFPAGWFGPEDGSMRWYLDATLAQVLITAAQQRVNDYEFDYEHQSLNAHKGSGPVPAAGWFKSLYWVDGEGLFADVTWTARATELIRADEYRYVSPTFYYDNRGCVRGLVNAALTNMPVIDGMQQVAASLMFYDDNGGSSVDEILEQLRWMLNLPLSATVEEVKAELQKLIDRLSGGEGLAAASISLGNILAEKDRALQDRDNQIAALSVAQQTGAPDPTKFVPVAVVDELRTTLAALSSQVNDDRVGTLLTAALSDGRVMAGADADNLRELGKKDFALMEKMIAARQPIQALSQTQTGARGLSLNDRGEPVADRGVLAVCSQFADFTGMDEKEIVRAVHQEMGGTYGTE